MTKISCEFRRSEAAGAIQGIFVTATDGDSVVIANVVCDISPENVKTLTSTATKIGMENGLAQVIEQKMKKFPGSERFAHRDHQGQ